MPDSTTLTGNAIDQVVNSPWATQPEQGAPQVVAPSPQAVIDSEWAPEQDAPKQSTSGLTTEPLSGWQSGYKAFTDRLKIGGAQANKAYAGWQLVAGGVDVNGAKQLVDTQDALQAQTDTEDYINSHAYQNLFKLRDLPGWNQEDKTAINAADIPGYLVEQIPQLATVGAGAAYGAMFGSVFGPGGLGVGALVGGALATGTVIAGSHIYDSMQRGVDRQTATIGGAVSGLIGGVATTLGMGMIGKMLPTAAEAVFASSTFREAVAHGAITFLKGAGVDVAAGDVQSLTDSSVKYLETRVAHVDHPFTIQEGLHDLVMAHVQQTVIAGALGSVSTGVGMHAGFRAKAMQARIDSMTAGFQAKAAQEQAAKAQKSDTDNVVRQTEVAGKIVEQKAAARKNLKGFIETDEAIAVPQAMQNLREAEAVHEAALAVDKPRTKLAVAQADAELKQARYKARLASLEDALTDPNLVERTAQHKAELEARIDTTKEMIFDAEMEAEPGRESELSALKLRLKSYQSQLKEVNQLAALGSEEKIRAEVEAKKATIEKHAQDSQLNVAEAAITRRMADRAHTIKSLKAFIRDVKKQSRDVAQDWAGAPGDDSHVATAERRERIEILKQQQQLDEILLGMIQDKTVSPEDIADLSAQTPTKRLIALVKVAQRQVERAATMSATGQKKLMTAAKRLLDSVVDLSRLPKTDKLALKAKYDVVDLNKVQAAIPELEESIKATFDKRRLEAAHADLKAQLDRIGEAPGEASKVPDSSEKLLAIKQFARDPDAIGRFLVSLPDKLTEIEEAKLALIDLFPVGVKEMTVPQIERVIDNIVSLRETGKAEALRRLDERIARQKAKLAEVKEAIKPTEKGEKRDKDTVLNAVNKLWDDHIQANTNSWRGVMTLLTQLSDKLSDLSHILDPKSAFSEMHQMRIKWENRVKELVKQETGMSDKAWHRFLMKSNKAGDKLRYLYVDEVKIGLPATKEALLQHTVGRNKGKAFTLDEMMQIYNYLGDTDPDAVSRFSRGNKFSYPGDVAGGQSTREVIATYLNEQLPGWRGVADAQLKYYQEFHEVVDETSYRRFGRHIQLNRTYAGELLSGTMESADSRFAEFRRRTNLPGSVHARQGGAKPVEIRGSVRNISNHISQFAREHSMFEFEQDARYIFGDEELRDFIHSKIGPNTLKVIDKFIEDISLGLRRSYDTVDVVCAWLRENTYSRALGARPEQFAKQLTGFVQVLQKLGPDKAIDGYAYMFANPEKVHALKEKSGILGARLEIRDPDFKPDTVNKLRRFNSLLSLSVKAGDDLGVMSVAFPVYLEVLKQTGDEKAAIKAAETIADTTQSSGSIDELPSLFRGNALLRMFSIMAQEPTRQVEAINTAWRNHMIEGKAGSFGHYARIVGVTYAGAFLYNLMGYLVAYPFMTDDEREQKIGVILDQAALGPFSGVAILGQALTSVTVSSLTIALNQNTKAYEPKLLQSDVFNDFWKLFQRLEKLGTDGGDASDYWKAIMAAANALGDVTGLPVTNILKLPEPFLGVRK